ncbi:Tim44-like domain-containing protein [Desulfovibrio mangrovi]|uniref:Tim44 domain-containing protein n=1 Tax=Desulfovibrio mangrovi TaxID=2976983 RepID=UPI002247DCA5|nr:Tim44-like domain-containing protein [Desulfovibrio mangrovi]UZP65957.1 Tim44-like domain-containing protein [Desulfovibrio mangrovi]
MQLLRILLQAALLLILATTLACAQIPASEQYAGDQVTHAESFARLDLPPAERGLFYGLLSGSLIGSLLYDEPFSGVGVADMLVLMVVVLAILRFARNRITLQPPNQGDTRAPADLDAFRRQRNADNTFAQQDEEDSPPRRKAPPVDIPDDEPNPHLYDRAAQMWGHLQGEESQKPQRKRSEGFTDNQPAKRGDDLLTARDAYQTGDQPDIPASFDKEDFLKGAKMVFARLQHSWDARDMNDIAQFTTPEVHDEIKRQAAQSPEPSRSELLLVNARILEVKEDEHGLLATVFFDVLMREDKDGAQTEQVREIWHFLKSAEYGGMWRLDGIEQVSA